MIRETGLGCGCGSGFRLDLHRPVERQGGKRAGFARSRRRRRNAWSMSATTAGTSFDADPGHTARQAGLRHVSDDQPGMTRLRAGQTFRYRDREGEPIRDADTLARIAALAIPPAWTQVWICHCA